MREVTLENGGRPLADLGDPLCTHIVINDQEVRAMPMLTGEEADADATAAAGSVTPTGKPAPLRTVVADDTFGNARASVVRAEWFWASIQICCRASECLYEFTKVSVSHTLLDYTQAK